MAAKNAKNFSHVLKVQNATVDQLEAIKHPLIKQIVNQLLAEEIGNESLGSGFGEAVQPAG